ncbi:MAG TPA: AMP-binding protein [Casimicrobiaceae bacterium]|nr:AMP-binding protein [Casimicrobiaceae bacterium]
MSERSNRGAAVSPYAERRRQIESEPLPRNMGALLDDAASAAPEGTALDFFERGERLTYRALKERVDRLAAGLARAGVRKGSHVGVMLPNTPEFPLTWLALARLGAVMIPLNIAFTPREMSYVVGDAEAQFLVVDEERLGTLAALPERPAGLTDDHVFVVGSPRAGQQRWDALEDTDVASLPNETVDCDDLMNIQYTSGTTGFPKGCLLTQRYWLTIGKVNARRDGVVYARILASTPFFYMDPQWLLMMSFYQRATLYVSLRQSASRFMQWVRTQRIQFCLFPEIVYKQPPSPLDRDNEVIRANVYGLNKGNHAALEQRFGFVVREAFGMTEVGSGLFMPIEATDMVGSGSCGIPVPFREARIADADGMTVAPGETGELLLRGPAMLRGYYRKPEATAAAFHGEWFRTGDLFRQDERGYYYIVGRVKEMIRRAGENISAHEVEAVLRQMPEIVEAAAVPVPDATRDEEVKVFVVLRPGLTRDDVPPPRIVAHCEANLARFKVPRYVAYIDRLPKTPSEKIAKHLLAGPPHASLPTYDRVEARWLA